MAKALMISLCLLLFVAQIPFFGSREEQVKEPDSPVKGWWEVKYFGVPPTRYSTAGKGIIKAESVGSRSSLFRETKEQERDLPLLVWGWKVSNIVRSAIETRRDRFDSAARVILIFGRERPWRRFGIGEPQGLKIEYIWATHLPRGHLFDHPSEKHCKIFVVESGEGRAGQWLYYQRDIRKDFTTAFGSEPLPVVAVGLQTDTDQSNEMVTAFYTEPRLRRRAPDSQR